MSKENDFQVEAYNRNQAINRINDIIDKHGDFNIADVEADHSPQVTGKSNLVHLMEDFTQDGGKVYVYNPQSHSSDEIDRYDASYEDLEDDQLEYTLELAEKWKEIKEEENEEA